MRMLSSGTAALAILGTAFLGMAWFLDAGLPLYLLGLGLIGVAGIPHVVGLVGDRRYNNLVRQGKASYRLPYRRRWDGWEIGVGPNSHYKIREHFHDRRTGHKVWIWNSISTP